MVQATLHSAIGAFRQRQPPGTDRLRALLDELEAMMRSPGQQEAHEITEQPLPTGQIPDPERKEFSATN